MRSDFLAVAVLWFAAATPGQVAEADRDGDGLSDHHEVHKYLTDPANPDSDGDGVGDGDWLERREYQYFVRCVVQVMRPVTPQYLTDDYQDVRVLDETVDYVELEVVHYPFQTVNRQIPFDAGWRDAVAGMVRWTEPGTTANWNPGMRTELVAALGAEGVDVASSNDRDLVACAADWSCRHARYHDGFSTFVTAFDDDGRPLVPEHLVGRVEKDRARSGMTLEEQWQRELFAAGMFENGARGSCTSTAIYLAGCMRALGVPTRIVLCIPLVDASDPSELDLVRRGLRHSQVRRVVLAASERLRGSWASHTFNEVFVAGRWRRLNGPILGQDSYDPGLFGLMTHVATFDDWADADMPSTVGRRQAESNREDVFGGANPYSTVSLRDGFGEHYRGARSVDESNPLTGELQALVWSDDPALPEDIREWGKRRPAAMLFARIAGVRPADWRTFVARAPLRLWLRTSSGTDLGVSFDPGNWWGKDGAYWVPVSFGAAGRRALRRGVEYTPEPGEATEGAEWTVAPGLTVTRR